MGLAGFGACLRGGAIAFVLLGSSAAWAQQLPTGGAVAAGTAAIVQPNATTLNINQSTNQAIINWNSFSVGAGGTVNFNQPGSSSATLNRVVGSTPSSIAGMINAPGTVLLVNPNGIAITKDGVINTGSFAASTLDIKDSDFLAGKYTFGGNGGSAAVTNAGRINVSDGGFAALLGGQVANSGVISARLGKVGLGAGELITLDLAGDGFLSVAVPSSQLGKLVDANGALVTNSGKIRANGGTVYLSAATASTLLRDAVNVPGSIRANSVGTHNGRIFIGGGGGTVSVTGQLAAKGRQKGEKGGLIDIAGANIKVLGALIDASGAAGGGLVRIGGTFQGGGADPSSALYQSYVGRFGALPEIASAETVIINGSTHIDVSATQAGDAGTVVVWSNDTTTFAGSVAGLGAGGGNGGFVEISGKLHLATSGTFDLSAAGGKFGTVLFDPGSINIQHGGNTYAGSDTLNDGYINGLLATADVIVDTNYGTGANGATGDITLLTGTAISWNASTTLTLNAARNIVFQTGSSVITSAGSVVLAAGNNASGVGTVTFQGAGAQVTETGGGSVTAYYNPAAFGTADFNSAGVSGNLTAYMLINSNGQLTAINSNLSGNYALATNLDFGTFGNFCVNCFFQPLGDFSGKLDGRGHSINFTVYSNQSSGQGLFQSIAGSGVVENLNVTARISSGYYLGGIAGVNNGLIDNVSASVNSVWVFDFNNTYAAGSTSGLGTTYIGGLVGINNGTINNSTASLTTNGVGLFAGGLAGQNTGTISNSSSTGGFVAPNPGKSNNNPTVVFNVGGLVGWNTSSGVITKSWSSATVYDEGLASIKTYDGGLVGYNEVGAHIDNSYATGRVRGGTYVGGFVGVNLGIITLSFSTGAASSNPGSGWSGDVGGFAGWNGIVLMGNLIGALPAASITQSWTASPVSGGNTPLLRGFAALDGAGDAGANNYFDVTATGQSVAAKNEFGQDCACGALPVTSATAYLSSSYSAGFMGTAWYMVDGYTRPIQTAFRTSTIGTSDALMSAIQLELVGSSLSSSYKLIKDIDLGIVQSSIIWSSAAGFGPIGSLNGGFTGTFDGQGNVIRNLFINQPSSGPLWTGLFGNVGVGGTVQNVGLEGGSVTGFQVVGALVGSNSGSVYNSYSTLNVAATNNVGGLVGVNNGTIASSYATGNVNGASGNGSTATGGLVGLNFGTITDAYATGDVTGGTQSANLFAGGIAGVNNGTISNVYYTGTVTGYAGNIGAIVGDNTSLLEQNTGDPDYLTYYVTVNHVINNGYWNSDLMASATGTAVGTLNGGGGLSYAQMTDQTNFATTFAGFNFNQTWSPPNQAGQGGDATAHTPGLYAASNIIWVEANNVSRSYGDANPTLTYTVHGVRTGDPLWLISGISLTTAADPTSNVGTYGINFGTPQATGRNGTAYRFTTSGTMAITPRALTGSVTITGIDKIYDGNTDAAGGAALLSAANNLVNGDSVTLSALTGTYADANVVGLEAVTLNSVSLSNGNYSLGTLTYTGTGSISQKTVTVALTGVVQKTYDGTDIATLASNNYAALSGVIAADIGNVSVNNPAAGQYSDANASASLKNVTVTGIQLTGSKSGNYAIASSVSGVVGQIDKRALSGIATITGIDKTYDKTAAASGGSASLSGGANNIVLGDTVLVSAATGTYASVNAGPDPQVVTVTSVTVGNSNYSIGSLSATGSGTISPLAITVTAATDSKVYDGGTGSLGMPTVTSTNQIIAGDIGIFSQVFASKNVMGTDGSTLVASGSVNDGNNGGNYSIQFVGALGTITPATLTVAAVADNRVYNGTTSSTGVPLVVSGLVGGSDSASGFTQDFTAKDVLGPNGSTLAVNAGSGTVSDGNNGANYSIVYQTALGTITAAPLTIAAVSDNRVYDGTVGSSLTPVVASGEIFQGDTANFIQVYASKNVLGTGNSTLVASGAVADGNAGNNYVVQFTNATGTITPAPLTVSAVTDSRTYDGTMSSNQAPIVSGQVFAGDVANFGQEYASKNVLGALGSTLNASGAVSDTNGGANYAVQFVSASGTITPLAITVTAATDSKTYDGGTGSSGAPTVTSVNQIVAGDSGNFGQVFASKNVLGANGSTLAASGSVDDTNGGANYTVQFVDTAGTITPAPLTITAVANTKTYDTTMAAAATPTVSGLQGGTDTVTGLSEVYADPNVGTGKTLNVATYTVNDGNGGANYTVQTVASLAGVIDPATLTYVANPASRLTGAANPAFSGGVTGFLGSDTLLSATTGALLFTSLANASSPPGNYAIDGSGLAAMNYIFVQAAGNATALMVIQVATDSTSQATPPGNNPPNPGVDISFQSQISGPIQVSFTPPPRLASTPSDDIVTGSLPDASKLAANNGHSYLPISQFDANQYSQFKLPGYEGQAGDAAIFTMIARGVDQEHAANYLIDTFWNGTSGSWKSDDPAVAGKVTFSDGTANNVDPNGNGGFPIVPGNTDIGQMLKNGPVIIGGVGQPTIRLLATQMTPDGQGIIANDPASGKQVVLSYDASAKSLGGVTGVYDAKTKGFVSLADASADFPAGSAGPGALQGFTPATFIAVTVK